MTRFSRRFILVFPLTAALLFTACGPADQHEAAAEGEVAMAEKVSLKGKVVSIDAATKTVVVEGERGQQIAIVAPKESPNFDQIKVGDPVTAVYVESIAVAIAPVADAKPGVSETVDVSTAPKGSTPSATITEQIELRAVVKAVDPETRQVTLDVPGGGERILKAGNDIDIAKVKVGEQVSVTLTRALAISIDKE